MSKITIHRSAIALVAGTLAAAVLGVHAEQAAAANCLGLPLTIPAGSPEGEVIEGTDGPDVINAGGGDDVINGLGGDDLICGDAGNDAINGDAGNDAINGDADNDAINGGAGRDTLDAGAGVADQAQYYNAPGPVSASLANHYADVVDGRDTLLGFERLVGSQFPDLLIGDSGANSFIGLEDIDGGLETDDRMYGGPGNDSVKYNWRFDPVTVDLESGRASGQGNDLLNGIESIVGTIGNDTISGNGVANTLAGLAGADVIEGRTGVDVLFGGSARDELRGGFGSDELRGEAGNDVLDGGPGYDSVAHLADAGDVLGGGTGIDWATYRSHINNVVITVDGVANDGVPWQSETDNVLTDVEDVTGTRWGDTIVGSARSNRLFGTEGDDTLRGGAGNDSLQGEAGRDSLLGDVGSDTLYARDGTADLRIDCGDDPDFAYLDAIDPPSVSCETPL